MIKYSIGLDISSKKINACISVIDQIQKVKVKSSTTISNSKSGFKELDSWIRKHHRETSVPLVVCMEATGNYHESCALFLSEKQYSVSVLLANKAKNYLRALGLKTKNDSIDAKGLAQMGAEQSLAAWSPHSRFFYGLRTLTRHHQTLQEQKTVTGNQLHAVKNCMFKSKEIEKQHERMIKLIDSQLKKLEELIKKHIQSDPEVYERIENIRSIKGIGLLTAATIVAETNGFDLFENSKQLVCYAGYDVIENQSGRHTGKTKISKRGNSRIRRSLFMPSFVSVTHKVGPFVNLYDRTYEKHKVKMKSYVAVQKKLLTTIYALWKKNMPFIEDYQKTISKEQEQELYSPVSFEKAEKSSAEQVGTTQGKHPSELSQYASSPVIQS